MSLTQSLIALTNFKSQLKNFKTLKNGNLVFTAIINYNWNNTTELELLKVTIHESGFEAGKISFKDGKKINSNHLHMDFSPEWQEYSFTKDSKLKIKGLNSPRIGDYEI